MSLWLGQSLEPLGKIPPVALIFVLCLVVTMLTEICNNVVVSTIMLPVFASMVSVNTHNEIFSLFVLFQVSFPDSLLYHQAKTLSIHPLYIMIPPTIGSSLAFMLPVATPPNALTFSYAKLSMIDMVRSLSLEYFLFCFYSCYIIMALSCCMIADKAWICTEPSWYRLHKFCCPDLGDRHVQLE